MQPRPINPPSHHHPRHLLPRSFLDLGSDFPVSRFSAYLISKVNERPGNDPLPSTDAELLKLAVKADRRGGE